MRFFAHRKKFPLRKEQNVTIVNGEKMFPEKKKVIDELKEYPGENVSSVMIGSPVIDVAVRPSDSDKIIVHLYGKASIEGNLSFEMESDEDILKIKAGVSDACNICGNIQVDVFLPKKVFKVIIVDSLASDITLSQDIS